MAQRKRPGPGSRAVFFDRDGTINVNIPYLSDPAGFRMYRGVIEGIKSLKKNGFKVIVVTNQSGIGRGYFTEKQLNKIHEKMKNEFWKFNIKLDGIYYCPHRPEAGCGCRKPGTELFEKAIKEHGIDVKRSFMVGDKGIDVEAGKKIGVLAILVPEPHERKKVLSAQKKWKYRPDHIADDLAGAAGWILEKSAVKK